MEKSYIFPFCQEMEIASIECFYVVSCFLVSPDRCVSVVAVVAAVVVVVVKYVVHFPCMCHTYFTYILLTYFGSR